jgi:hypothetical protein
VTQAGRGGAWRFTQERIGTLRAQGIDVLTLRPRDVGQPGCVLESQDRAIDTLVFDAAAKRLGFFAAANPGGVKGQVT